MNTYGLIGRIGNKGGSYHDWPSRDHADIDCKAIGCIYNHAEKCMVPSRCEITPDGRCKGFEAKPTPQKPDGD